MGGTTCGTLDVSSGPARPAGIGLSTTGDSQTPLQRFLCSVPTWAVGSVVPAAAMAGMPDISAACHLALVATIMAGLICGFGECERLGAGKESRELYSSGYHLCTLMAVLRGNSASQCPRCTCP